MSERVMLDPHGGRVLAIPARGEPIDEPAGDPLPGLPVALRAIRKSGGDHADRLEREADELEARAFAMRLEAFHTRNQHRLASRHAIGESP